MILPLSRPGALALLLTIGVAFGPSFRAAAQTADASASTQPAGSTGQPLQPAPVASASPAAADQQLATEMVDQSTRARHLAPHDTFYLLTYVAVRTSDGVEGFDPGQEVHLVEVHRATHTLVVSDGHAQVEVVPSQLTNDMDIAALVRQKDEASQARIAAHVRSEQLASARYERAAAAATAADLAQRRQQQQDQAVELQKEEQTPVAQTAEPSPPSVDADSYYGYGGYGYGNPYSYFTGSSGRAGEHRNTTAAPASGAGAAPAAGRTANPATVGTAGRPPR